MKNRCCQIFSKSGIGWAVSPPMGKAGSEETQGFGGGEARLWGVTGWWAARGKLPKAKWDFQCDCVVLSLLGFLNPLARVENTLSQGLKVTYFGLEASSPSSQCSEGMSSLSVCCSYWHMLCLWAVLQAFPFCVFQKQLGVLIYLSKR